MAEKSEKNKKYDAQGLTETEKYDIIIHGLKSLCRRQQVRRQKCRLLKGLSRQPRCEDA